MARKKYTLNLAFSEIAPKMMAICGFKHYVDLAKFLEITPQSINKFRVDNRFPTNLVIKFAVKNRSSLDELLNISSIEDPFQVRRFPEEFCDRFRLLYDLHN